MYKGQVEEALANAFPISHVIGDETSPGFVVQYVPELGTGATAATAVWTSTTDITFTTGGTTPADEDVVGESGVVATATYTTMGAVQDAINASRCFRCYLITCLRADLSASTIKPKVATSCIGAHGVTFYIDQTLAPITSIYVSGFAISGEFFTSNKASGWRKDWDAQCMNVLTYLACTQANATGATLNLYEGKQGETEILLWSSSLADATLKEINSSLSKEISVASRPGYRLIVRLHADTNVVASPFNGTGKTAVLTGQFGVTRKNYGDA
ncbi:MAG: hypothetical protein WC356_04265 [Candidatus Micrarchaeia archaeon]|jgi:hypothetical protein